ncbi:MAG: chorismate mutase [Hyphomicrobiales bacterium]
MAELRCEIDELDRSLIEMLALRAQCIDRAITLKKVEGIPARATDRVEEVVRKVRASAAKQGLDEELVEKLWCELIEWSIERESKHLD